MIVVSVVIPAFNAARFIGQTIESVLSQTFQEFEIVVADDGSQDETARIVESFGDQRVRLLRLVNNGGVSAARNAAMRAARGKYIAFLDADDLWKPEKLARQVALLDADASFGLCFAATERIDENGIPGSLVAARDYPNFTVALLLYLCVSGASPSAVMARADLIAKTDGFDVNLTNYEDWEFWLRLSLLTKFAPLNEVLVQYRVTSGSASFNVAKAEKSMLYALDKFFAAPNLPAECGTLKKQIYSNHWAILSGSYLHAKKPLDSVRCLFESVRRHPRNVLRPLGLPLRWTARILKNKTD